MDYPDRVVKHPGKVKVHKRLVVMHPLMADWLELVAGQWGFTAAHLIRAAMIRVFDHVEIDPDGLFCPDAKLRSALERAATWRFTLPPEEWFEYIGGFDAES